VIVDDPSGDSHQFHIEALGGACKEMEHRERCQVFPTHENFFGWPMTSRLARADSNCLGDPLPLDQGDARAAGTGHKLNRGFDDALQRRGGISLCLQLDRQRTHHLRQGQAAR
jgi:hypothetical protein